MTDDPADTTAGSTSVFRVLYVCRENVCRSPVAEQLTRHLLQARFGDDSGCIEVSSVGTHARPNRRMHPLARRALLDRGIESPPIAAAQISAEVVEAADLVLTATRVERSEVVEAVPSAVRRVFTIAQFARLAQAGADLDAEEGLDPPRSGEELLAAAIRGRAQVQPDPEGDDITDPAGPDLADFSAVVNRIQEAVGSMVDLLDAPPAVPSRRAVPG